jgi:hypothetical protein
MATPAQMPAKRTPPKVRRPHMSGNLTEEQVAALSQLRLKLKLSQQLPPGR